MSLDLVEVFPDGTPVSAWFYDTDIPSLDSLGRQYILTDYGITGGENNLCTDAIQSLIDKAASDGGGVVVVPEGIFYTGALFFKAGVNLYICRGGVLRGSDDIADYPVVDTRIEGVSCKYFSALINVSGADGLTMCGEGTIDGSGMRAWKAFWQRRSWNPDCTNKDEQRARLVYIDGSSDVTIAGLHMRDSQFWTTHLYRCSRVKVIGCSIESPRMPVKAPSTDAIDIDVCSDVLIKDCYISVNDDAVALKGGKGPWADSALDNGINERIIIEDCRIGFCHGCLTCGSESVHNKNVIMRRIAIEDGYNLLWLKLRPDTPQVYENILVENVSGRVSSFININPWTQFYDLAERNDIPLSYVSHVTMRKCTCTCDMYYNVKEDESQYILSDITLADNEITQTGDEDAAMAHIGAE